MAHLDRRSQVPKHFIKLKTMGDDNLDFHIAYYLGKYAEIANPDIEFHVVTKDNGFNGLVSHIKNTGRKCSKVTFQVKPKKKPKKKSKVSSIELSPSAQLAITRLTSIDGRKRPRKKEKPAAPNVALGL
jgi:hypothetical protein